MRLRRIKKGAADLPIADKQRSLRSEDDLSDRHELAHDGGSEGQGLGRDGEDAVISNAHHLEWPSFVRSMPSVHYGTRFVNADE